MRRITTLFFCFIFFTNTAESQYVNIPDANLRAHLQGLYPGCFNGAGQMDTTCSTIVSETRLNLSSTAAGGDCNYMNFSGVQYFKNLRYFNCSNNNCIDLSGFPLAVTLDTLLCAYIPAGPLSFPPNLSFLNCQANGYIQLPPLPSTLRSLYCGNNNLAALPPLPAQLLTLECQWNNLGTLPQLPATLQTIDCSYANITSLPALPNSLISLVCFSNHLTSLPALPENLASLIASNNQLTSLPPLPASLREIFVASNLYITELPELPPLLGSLGVNGNSLSFLPSLPASLTFLDCSYNYYLSSLPELPNNLLTIKAEGNSINCLPQLPKGDDTHGPYLTIDAYKIHCLPNRPLNSTILRWDENGQQVQGELPLCSPVTNIDHCQAFPVMSGNVFIDLNNNGVKDANEYSRRNCPVRLSAGNYTFTNNDGDFEISADSIGTINLSAAPPAFFSAAPASIDFNFSSYDTLVYQDFALQATSSVDSMLLSVVPFNWAARPGFSFPYLISYENTGTTILSPNIVFNYDNTRLIYDSSSNAAVVNNSNNLSFSAGSFMPGQQGSFIAYFTLKPTAMIGDTLSASGTINAGAYTVTNNNTVLIRGSFDPNDKQATPQLSPSQVANGKYIDYTIRFQNTGTDTAFNIVVSDTLNGDLQAATLQMIASSHSCKATVKDNIIFFEFLNILLPDSNVNEPKSHGFVNFRIKPESTVAVNTIIPNKAAIYFDYNAPVITNTAGTLIKEFTVVPLRLISFSAVPQTDHTTTLHWNTANEINTKHFVIEQSNDAVRFNAITTITAKGNAGNHYNASINEFNSSIIYYRLKIVDNDGSFTYSPIIKIDRRKNAAGFSILTNPVKDFIIINTTDRSFNNTTGSIINTNGTVVKSFVITQGSQTIETKNLPAGIYYLRTVNGSSRILIH